MIQIRRFLTRPSFTNIIALLSFLISLIVLVRDHYQSERIDQLSYTTSAVQFRPNLKIVDHLRIENHGISTRIRHLDAPGTKDIPAMLGMDIKLKCVNTGNSLARIINIFLTDTMSGEEKLRALLTDKARRQSEIVPVSFNNYYKTQDLSSGDTIDIETEHMVTSYQHEKFTLHFLILYQNETGALFDTYYWVQFEVGQFKLTAIETLIDGKRDIFFSALMPPGGVVLRLIDSHSSTQMYSQEAAKDILRFISSIPRKDGGG